MPEKNDEVKFTLKLHPELAAKLNYIAEYLRAHAQRGNYLDTAAACGGI